jgi:hypothetical protein
MENVPGNAQLDAWLDKKLDELLPKKLEEIDASKTPSMAIIATKGTLDWAYPPFILASTAVLHLLRPAAAEEEAQRQGQRAG